MVHQLEQTLLDEILPQVSKPARYIGDEVNAVRKDWDGVKTRFLFAFPDLYDVGMSHLGMKILYSVVNNEVDLLCERAFAPDTDMESIMREKGVPLFSLESFRPATDFDVIGFTLQYELSYTNLLNMLDLAGMPVRTDDRAGGYPLVIAGGPCAYNPEPLAPFVDAFVIGEGEEVILEVLRAVSDHSGSFDDLLVRLASIEGVYVPRLYSFAYEGVSVSSLRVDPPAPAVVYPRRLANLDAAPFPDRFVVPYIDAVHDRATVELFRGCTRGCRFCQAGMIYRPVREKSPEVVRRQAQALLDSTGYDELSLMSLSSADYSAIREVADMLLPDCLRQQVSLSLPSLRVDSFSIDLANKLSDVRKSGITFAPEAGTQRMRDVINKNVTEGDLLRAVEAAASSGWNPIKLYFMIGLPFETDDDVRGIADLSYKVLRAARDAAASSGLAPGRIQVNVSVSSFVPKPHTPFQWVAQNSPDEFQRKIDILKDSVRHRSIKLSWSNPDSSLLEGALSRGDRRLAPVIESAWRKGCRFDSWTDHFRPGFWWSAFAENGYDARFFAGSARDVESILPWDHISTGVSKRFLRQELLKAKQGEATRDCRTDACTGCGVCPSLGIKPSRAIGGQSNVHDQA